MKGTTVVAVTGASGAVLARRLLDNLEGDTALILSEHGSMIARHELGVEGGLEGPGILKERADIVYDNDDLAAPVASGSHPFGAMVIVPCSTSTLSKIACGIGDNLITRTAGVCLKERRRLVIVPRETPVSTIHLENMARLSRDGTVILPAMLNFYSRPSTLEDVVDALVGRILDVLGQENELTPRWQGLDERTGPPLA